MKAVFWIAVLLLCGAMAVFGFENGQEVSVTVFGTVYHAVKLKYVAFAALLIGVTFTGLVAMLEGANLRLANRRLRREIARLETEMNHLRTQPSSGGATAPTPGRGPARDTTHSIADDDAPAQAADASPAPVYAAPRGEEAGRGDA